MIGPPLYMQSPDWKLSATLSTKPLAHQPIPPPRRITLWIEGFSLCFKSSEFTLIAFIFVQSHYTKSIRKRIQYKRYAHHRW